MLMFYIDETENINMLSLITVIPAVCFIVNYYVSVDTIAYQ